MLSEHDLSLLSALISLAGLVFVGLQLRAGKKQRQMESLVKLYDINRELISLAFSHPKLLEILEDAKDANPLWERRYLQMWLNQLSLSYAYMEKSRLPTDLKESLTRNVEDFMTMENMRRQWQTYGSFYPTSFQKFVTTILKKNEPPKAAAHAELGG